MADVRVALVGDYDPAAVAHQAIPKALQLAGAKLGASVEPVWVHTASITNPEIQFADFTGIWCVPASPYASMEGALRAIRYARQSGRPFLGTCGGFQHAVIEYARNVCGLTDAEHAETHPDAACLVVTPLSCSLVEQTGEIVLQPGGVVHRAYAASRITEGYHCSYGLNSAYQSLLFADGLRPTAHDCAGAVRAIELSGHPFFIATLFQPERRALRGEVPPLVEAFIEAQRSGTPRNRLHR
jgi:CTP synthase (UTP-ammonia lyase)